VAVSGGHLLVALIGGQTVMSLGDDKMTGSATGPTTFVLNYGAGTITNLTSAAQRLGIPADSIVEVGEIGPEVAVIAALRPHSNETAVHPTF